ncbi:hypothetical protein FHW36_112118 [Chitinophaga polysaccharea]|uniref:Uncharacterized protein n=1 Tax=Chitinophaga polysaccharea TaxID=1293035 RepID=A0A561P6D1_9BACT|nr:hypothetical protein FHW36_112118 [Chitinophaga polysaccharea]
MSTKHIKRYSYKSGHYQQQELNCVGERVTAFQAIVLKP